MRQSLCHLLWCLRFLTPPGVILPPCCLLLASLGSLLGLGPGTEGLLTGTRLLFIRAPVRCLDLLCTIIFVVILTRSAKSVCLALLATSPSRTLLLTWRSSKCIRLQNWTYFGLFTFPARQRAFALLTSLLVAAFRRRVWNSLAGKLGGGNQSCNCASPNQIFCGASAMPSFGCYLALALVVASGMAGLPSDS